MKDLAAKAVVKRYHERPKEELYDLAADPYEMKNLAPEPKQADTLKKLSAELDAWMKAQGDAGKTAGARDRVHDYRPPPGATTK